MSRILSEFSWSEHTIPSWKCSYSFCLGKRVNLRPAKRRLTIREKEGGVVGGITWTKELLILLLIANVSTTDLCSAAQIRLLSLHWVNTFYAKLITFLYYILNKIFIVLSMIFTVFQGTTVIIMACTTCFLLIWCSNFGGLLLAFCVHVARFI